MKLRRKAFVQLVKLFLPLVKTPSYPTLNQCAMYNANAQMPSTPSGILYFNSIPNISAMLMAFSLPSSAPYIIWLQLAAFI
ncbi:hypothetical protein L218DRAFT_1002513 [Marasmius fiardii PR-910]|nr:hypothetical protein L218DRAFT_1002513 [Marasmius fiardii PR-910]